MKKSVKTTVMLLLFLGIVLTTNAQKKRVTGYYYAIATSYNKNAEEGDRDHVYFSPIISRTFKGLKYEIDYFFSTEEDEFENMWLKECKIRYDNEDEYWEWKGYATRIGLGNMTWFGWADTERKAYSSRQSQILKFKRERYIKYTVHH